MVERRGSAERLTVVTTTLLRPAAPSTRMTLAAVVGLLASGCGTQGPDSDTSQDTGRTPA